MEIRIVRIGKEDMDDFARLLFHFFDELRRKQGWRPPSMTEIEAEAQKAFERNDIVLMAYEKGNPLGFVRVSTHHEDAVFWIEEVFVIPEFRRRGIARELVESAEKEVLKRGEISVYLFVLPQDKEAISFWKSMGYGTLNSIELVKDLRQTRRGDQLFAVELLGERFDVFGWAESQFDELETEFARLLHHFYAQGGDKKMFLSIVNKALKSYLDKKAGTYRDLAKE